MKERALRLAAEDAAFDNYNTSIKQRFVVKPSGRCDNGHLRLAAKVCTELLANGERYMKVNLKQLDVLHLLDGDGRMAVSVHRISSLDPITPHDFAGECSGLACFERHVHRPHALI